MSGNILNFLILGVVILWIRSRIPSDFELNSFYSDLGSFPHTCPDLLSDKLFNIYFLILQNSLCIFAETILDSIPSIFFIAD